MIDQSKPDFIHIATEGPLGLAARACCRRRRLGFTSSFHTNFPDYLQVRFGLPSRWTRRLLRRFHAPATRTMVATRTIERELAARGFSRLAPWRRGVDLDLFAPGTGASQPELEGLPRPVFLNVGRVAVEKNLPAFLDLELPGSKVVVGDGPLLSHLARQYPRVRFLGRRTGADLARCYAASDVFVFPSRTDTFGLVLLEALASGLPIAAFPESGPVELVGAEGGHAVGRLGEDLGLAARQALDLDRRACRASAQHYSWASSAMQFLNNLEPAIVP